MELNQLIPYIKPVPIFALLETDRGHASNPVVGDWVNMLGATRCLVEVKLGTLAHAVKLQLKQASDNAGTSAKFVDATLTVYKPDGTMVNVAFDDTSGLDIAATDDGSVVYIEMRHQALDKDNDFTHFQLYAAATGGAGDYIDGTYIFYSTDFSLGGETWTPTD